MWYLPMVLLLKYFVSKNLEVLDGLIIEIFRWQKFVVYLRFYYGNILLGKILRLPMFLLME